MPDFRLSLIYGFRPNALGLCGPQDKKNKKIIAEIIQGSHISDNKARAIAKNFKGAHPYYELIAKANHLKDPLSREAVGAYWIGSGILERVRFADFERMAKDKFFFQNIPLGSLPHHSFHVLNIGRINGKLEEHLLDYCLVKWGRVAKIKGSKVIVDNYEELKKRKGAFYFALKTEKEVVWDKRIAPDLEIGDWVSIHWQNIIEKINAEQLKNLKKYTRINLRAYDQCFRKKSNK